MASPWISAIVVVCVTGVVVFTRPNGLSFSEKSEPVPTGPKGVVPVVVQVNVTVPEPVVGVQVPNRGLPVLVRNEPEVALTYCSLPGSNETVVVNEPAPHVLIGWLLAMLYDDPADGTAGDQGAVVVITVPVFEAMEALTVDTSR